MLKHGPELLSFLRLKNTALYVYTTLCLSIHLLVKTSQFWSGCPTAADSGSGGSAVLGQLSKAPSEPGGNTETQGTNPSM